MTIRFSNVKQAVDLFWQSVDTTSVNKRLGFNHNVVEKLSLSQICIGFISMLFGIVVEISGATIRNDEEYHRFYFSMLGAGLWCGLIFIAVGYFGIETTRRKSTCFIVALMALAMSSMMFAVLQMAIGICAMAGDRNVEIKNHRYYFQVPVVTFIFNLLLTLLGFFMVILLGTTVVYSSIATCCQSQPNFLRVNIYEPVRTPSSGYPQPMQLPSQMPYTNTESVYCAPQEYQETAKGEMQPLMLMPNNQFVSVQYQTSGFPHQNAQYTSTSQQTIFEHGQATAANENAASM